MDEDVQKALKQILRMCKMPTEAKWSVWDGAAYLSTASAGEETRKQHPYTLVS